MSVAAANSSGNITPVIALVDWMSLNKNDTNMIVIIRTGLRIGGPCFLQRRRQRFAGGILRSARVLLIFAVKEITLYY